jgi:hypothetical protein
MDNQSSVSCGWEWSLGSLNKELQNKDKLFTDMYDIIKAFKVTLQLQENKLKLHNLIHFPHLKSLDTIFPQHIEEYSQ